MIAHLNIRELPLDDCPSCSLRRCIGTWHHWRGERAMPSWGDVDLSEFPSKSLPLTLVADVSHDPLEFTYRYWGRGFTQIHGVDLTNQTNAGLGIDEFADTVFRVYQHIVEHKSPLLYEGNYLKWHGVTSPEVVLRLPLSDNGKDVDTILSVVETDLREFDRQRHLMRED